MWPFTCLGFLVLLSLLSISTGKSAENGFRICAYNLQNFNKERASHTMTLHSLTRIVARCHITLLQHVVDPDGEAIKTLLASLNRYDGTKFHSVSSELLGKSPNDMQQYVFIWRHNAANLTNKHQYRKDGPFVRAPFVVKFQSSKTLIGEFILVPLHSEPLQAIQEIDSLYDVFEEVSSMWNNTDVMFLGDFHAGCGFVTRPDRKSIRLYTNSSFSWLIGEQVDTTVTDSTTCPYDRIVVHGQPFLKAVVPYSGKVFNFGKEFKFSRAKVLDVSDHYPVEVRLKGSGLPLQATPLTVILCVAVVARFLLPGL
ncbi:deoxyribonuclease-1 isoform X2 [Oryzias melastigma]|uniref:Deoxyribonuclease n=1 Tax=Oryzias melastigma TaxID=30732 RepID=A0A3B3CBB8_ORYME|nr:deoxyribonuclease-1 isoform X2 [Oryzias melastigma]